MTEEKNTNTVEEAKSFIKELKDKIMADKALMVIAGLAALTIAYAVLSILSWMGAWIIPLGICAVVAYFFFNKKEDTEEPAAEAAEPGDQEGAVAEGSAVGGGEEAAAEPGPDVEQK